MSTAQPPSAAAASPPPLPVNPMLPGTVGALIAEESTIVPNSVLPSFLERMMMEECRRSGYHTLRTAMHFLTERLARMEQRSNSHNDTAEHRPSSYILRVALCLQTVLRRMSREACRRVRTRVLEPFGPELRFLLVYWLERKSLLSSSSATVAEALYGGKRVQLVEEATSSEPPNSSQHRQLRPLSKRDGIRLALLMALGPYLEERSDSIFKFLVQRISSTTRVSMATKRKLQILVQVAWPLVRMTTKATFWLYQWRYLLGWSVFFDPYSSYLNVILRRVTMEDHHHHQQQTVGVNASEAKNGEQSSRLHGEGQNAKAGDHFEVPPSLRQLLSKRSSWARKAVIGAISSAIALSFIARVQSIRNGLQQDEEEREEQRQQQLESGHRFPGSSKKESIPPPPAPANPNFPDDSTSTWNPIKIDNLTPKVCPICQEPRTNPTASNGGYVFCYKCILDFVKKEGVCPVTGRECGVTDLVRLYEPRT